ncbi:MAG: T9SS type A sorting domain-containing protein [Saprospiraceae bacterium]
MQQILKSILGIIFLFNCAVSQAQYIPMVEENKYWIYQSYYSNESNNIASGYSIKFKGDTTVNSISYKKVIKQGLSGTHPCPPGNMPCFVFDIPFKTFSNELIGFVREEIADRKTYFRPIAGQYCAEDEYLLFDFSLDQGDTLDACKIEALGGHNTFGIIDSITSEFLFDKNRSVQNTTGAVTYIGDPPIWAVKIIEGVGFENFGLFHMQGNLDVLYQLCEATMGQCNILSSNSTSLPANEELTVYPNPANQVLKIESRSEIEFLKIFDVNGKLMYSGTHKERIMIDELPEGIYFINVEFSMGKMANSKFVKIGQ